jgi:hypothetical protein
VRIKRGGGEERSEWDEKVCRKGRDDHAIDRKRDRSVE